MRLTLALPLFMLAGAGAATMHAKDLVLPKEAAAEPTRLGVSIDDDLAKRQARLDQRARALDLQERTLAAARGRVATAGPGPERPATRAPMLITPPDAEAEAKILQLARVYQAMKPRDAAVIFEQLPMPLQVKISAQMRERSVAGIMAAMTPPAASALTAAMAGGETAKPAARLLQEPAPAPSPPAPAARLSSAAQPKAG